jgi:DNA-binding beta-propeller fold protein YncE
MTGKVKTCFIVGTLSVALLFSSRGASAQVIRTVAGSGTSGFCGDGGPATDACLSFPIGEAVDATGNLVIADFGNSRVRSVDAVTGIITTVAGSATSGFCGDGGAATSACLSGPTGVAVNPTTGNLAIADFGNSRIRSVDAITGIITTVAGSATSGFCGDGGAATSACLNGPEEVAVDATGNVFIADRFNHRIRRVDAATGVITTVAGGGTPTPGFCGDGGAATSACLNESLWVAVDATGNLSIADRVNHRIRSVDAATGIITTVAGKGVAGFCGDGGPATSACLTNPSGVAVDPVSGSLLIGDTDNHRVRRVP